MAETDYMILGAGPAGCRAAQAIRKRDRSGRIVMLTEESAPFTNRIVLSKEFLTQDALTPERALVLQSGAFRAMGIDLRTRARIERLDPATRLVDLADGERLAYDRCLVATGSRPLTLPIPGFELSGVFTLRTVEDAQALREAARGSECAVVVGGGLIGAEIACALTVRGLGVTLLAREPWLWGHLAPEPVGRAAGRVLEQGGVDLRMERTVVAIRAEGRERIVETAGGEAFSAPLVVAGVGVRYNVEFLAGSGLIEPGRGVRVNERLETDAEGLWAAGDVAAFDDPVFGSRHHVEHWLHAQHQGRVAGENMTGARNVYARVSWYDTRLFDLPVVVVGAPELALRWSVEEAFEAGRGLSLGWRGERLVAAYRLGPGAPIDEIARRIEAVA